MKQKAMFLGLVFFTMLFFMDCAQQDDFPVLKGPYLGQKPPGITPEVFEPENSIHRT